MTKHPEEMKYSSIFFIVILSLLLLLIILMFYFLESTRRSLKRKEYFNKTQINMSKVFDSKLLMLLIFCISILLVIYSFYTLYTKDFKNQSAQTKQIIMIYLGLFFIIWYCFWAYHIKRKILSKSKVMKANFLTLFSILSISLLFFIISYLICNVNILANIYQLSVACIAILDLIILLGFLYRVVIYHYEGNWRRLFLNIKK
jgi:heme/copper-type cytochrome/quinol oxidase subunit 2